ncbi:MAG: hypothetical protein WBK97_08015 [Bacteroidales bacterium]|jgi:hypothetical protein
MRRNPHKVITLYFLPCLSALLLLGSCYGNPKKVVENAFLGTWHIDTSRVHLSISISPGASGDLSVLTAFVNNNYQSFRDLLKEPEKIVVTRTSAEDPSSGSYSLQFSSGYVYTGLYRLVRNVLFFQFYDTKGRSYTIPCQADGTTLQIVYSTPYMRALLQDYIAEHYPLESENLISHLHSLSPTLEGISVYSTRYLPLNNNDLED